MMGYSRGCTSRKLRQKETKSKSVAVVLTNLICSRSTIVDLCLGFSD